MNIISFTFITANSFVGAWVVIRVEISLISMYANIQYIIILVKVFWCTITNMNIPVEDYYFLFEVFFTSYHCCYSYIVEKAEPLIALWTFGMVTWWPNNSKWWVNMILYLFFITYYSNGFNSTTSGNRCRKITILFLRILNLLNIEIIMD